MLKQLIIISLLSFVVLGTAACNNEKEELREAQIEALNQKIERLEAREEMRDDLIVDIDSVDKEEDLHREQEKEAREKAQLNAELEKLRIERDAALKKAENKPAPAPKPVSPTNNYGPGDANNTNGGPQGYLKVRTKSANGHLTIRENPSTSSKAVTSRPNGYDDMAYMGYQKIDDYVWYNVEVPNDQGSYDFGWVRGDYVDRLN